MRRVLTLTGPREFGGWNKEADPAEETGWSYQGSGEQQGDAQVWKPREERASGREEGVVTVSMLLRAQKVCGLRTQLGAGNAVVTANLGWCQGLKPDFKKKSGRETGDGESRWPLEFHDKEKQRTCVLTRNRRGSHRLNQFSLILPALPQPDVRFAKLFSLLALSLLICQWGQ